jgi:hypothetical protein
LIGVGDLHQAGDAAVVVGIGVNVVDFSTAAKS